MAKFPTIRTNRLSGSNQSSWDTDKVVRLIMEVLGAGVVDILKENDGDVLWSVYASACGISGKFAKTGPHGGMPFTDYLTISLFERPKDMQIIMRDGREFFYTLPVTDMDSLRLALLRIQMSGHDWV